MTNRKDEIINLAMKSIQETGYVAFSYKDLAEELDVTKASIHYHFEKKEELGIVICDKIRSSIERNLAELEQENVRSEDMPLEFIRRRSSTIGMNGICPLSALQADFNDLPEAMQQRVQEISEREVAILEKLLTDAKEVGKLQDFDDLRALASMLIAGVKGGLQYRRVLGNHFFEALLSQYKILLK